MGNEQKIYQISYNLTCTELKIPMTVGDLAFTVNAASRQRDLIGLVDQRSFNIYKNDNGVISRFYNLNFSLLDIRGITQQAMFFFQREYVIVISKKKIYRVSTRTNSVQTLSLEDPVQNMGANVLLDGNFFYFLTKAQDDNSKLSCVSIDMIDG